ncbi:MAG: hypothetical protein ACHQD7_00140 [Chitinophagales bacterium]
MDSTHCHRICRKERVYGAVASRGLHGEVPYKTPHAACQWIRIRDPFADWMRLFASVSVIIHT